MEKIPINDPIENAKKVIEKYPAGTSISPLGEIEKITYSNDGKMLTIVLKGIVSSGPRKETYILINHPSSNKSGWLKRGEIGYVVVEKGQKIEAVPLSKESISLIRSIYRDYTGSQTASAFVTPEGVQY